MDNYREIIPVYPFLSGALNPALWMIKIFKLFGRLWVEYSDKRSHYLKHMYMYI